ncbi:hypothetical protein [Streptomyces sp. NBC_01373]|uniref:hypothetical protein n=1 Tax=unclassified Streptomyces TaxID=2593676 RepID=UPI00224CA31C|nr:hypothetical protein [Streptomyces sp. NBC_01373]MCX4703298.1 hypothetical protein [Streptomyces sp. NBC_01373]
MTSDAIATVKACFEAFGTRETERVMSHFAPVPHRAGGDPSVPHRVLRSRRAARIRAADHGGGRRSVLVPGRYTVADGLITDYRVLDDSLGVTRTYLGEPLATTLT